jgi:hypothetical protein
MAFSAAFAAGLACLEKTMSAQSIHDWLLSLQFGKRYYKPTNLTWRELRYQIETSTCYARHFDGMRLHQLRGDLFCLQCRHCGGLEPGE